MYDDEGSTRTTDPAHNRSERTTCPDKIQEVITLHFLLPKLKRNLHKILKVKCENDQSVDIKLFPNFVRF